MDTLSKITYFNRFFDGLYIPNLKKMISQSKLWKILKWMTYTDNENSSVQCTLVKGALIAKHSRVLYGPASGFLWRRNQMIWNSWFWHQGGRTIKCKTMSLSVHLRRKIPMGKEWKFVNNEKNCQNSGQKFMSLF